MEYPAREQAVTHDLTTPRRSLRLMVNADLLRRARELDLKVSAILESALVEAVRSGAQARWRTGNREAIEAYNHQVEREGCFGDRLRFF